MYNKSCKKTLSRKCNQIHERVCLIKIYKNYLNANEYIWNILNNNSKSQISFNKVLIVCNMNANEFAKGSYGPKDHKFQ